ncbi:MAG: AAA family ATPase [Planctomycetota bacterium]
MTDSFSPIDRVLGKLPSAKRSGAGWSARCPAHDDKRASLSINEGEDGRVVMKCHAGCDVKDIVAAMGLEMKDLFPHKNGRSHKPPAKQKQLGPIAKAYDYRDASGSLVFQVTRHDPKDFRQRTPGGNGGWRWKAAKQPLPLYRLPELLGAEDPSFVFVVEGEKDADRLAAGGLVATTVAGGAEKARTADLTPLHGRDVVIVPDNDEVGRRHAQALCGLLSGKASSVRVLQLGGLPDKGDVSDWLDAGNDVERLVALAEQGDLWSPTPSGVETETPLRRLVMRNGIDIDDGQTRYLWQRRLPLGAISVVFSRPGRGKSTLAADLTAHVTRGETWPDRAACRGGRVLILKGEGSDAAIRDRMELAGADPSRWVLVGRADDPDEPMIDLALDTGLVGDALDSIPDCRLVIVDTLDSMFPSMRSIDNANVRRCLWPLQELAEQRGLAVVLLAHTNKGGYADPLDRLSGGRAIGGAARAIWYLGKTDPEDDLAPCYMVPVKANDFTPAKPLEYSIVGSDADRPGRIEWHGEAEVSAYELDQPPKRESRDKSEEATRWLGDALAAGPRPRTEVETEAEQMGFGDFVLRKAKKAVGMKSSPAKGAHPPVWYWRLPGQSAPDLSNEPVGLSGGSP